MEVIQPGSDISYLPRHEKLTWEFKTADSQMRAAEPDPLVFV